MTTPDPRASIDLPSGVTLHPSQDEAIDRLLHDLLTRSPAKFILLAEASGQLLSALGKRSANDLVALGSLVAGDLAASQEIARLTEQSQNYHLILREASETNTFIAEAGAHLVLFVQVNKEVPLGWARMLIHETSRQLAAIVAARPEEVEKLDLGLSEEKINRLVGDGLDSILKG